MSLQPLAVRQIKITDILAVTRLTYENMRGVDPQFTALVNKPFGRWTMYLTLPLYFLSSGKGFKAVQNDRIVGCAYLHLRSRSGYVFNVSVSRPYRRQGAASRLMRHLETVTREQGRHWSVLQVDEGNLPARRLYEKLGYQEYHPHYFRGSPSADMRQATSSEFILEPVTRPKDRHLFDHYTRIERQAGDSWAARVVQEYDYAPPGKGHFWRCHFQKQEIGCCWLSLHSRRVVIILALKPAFWGHSSIGGLIQSLIDKVNADPSQKIDVYFASSEHHQAAEPHLEPLGFRTLTQPRLLMLKNLGP